MYTSPIPEREDNVRENERERERESGIATCRRAVVTASPVNIHPYSCVLARARVRLRGYLWMIFDPSKLCGQCPGGHCALPNAR